MTTQKQPSGAELDSMAEFMNEIGVEIAATIGDDLDGTFLYVEAGEGWEPTGIGHRTDILKQRYGTKRIVYPDWFRHLKGK